MSDIKESKSPPIPQAEFCSFSCQGIWERFYYSSSMICASPACKGTIEEGQDPYLTHLHHSHGSCTTSCKLKDYIFLSSSKWFGLVWFWVGLFGFWGVCFLVFCCLFCCFFFLISGNRELFRKTERLFAYFKMRFLGRFKRDLAFTIPQNIVNIQVIFLEGIINLMPQGLCQLLTTGRKPRR